MNPKQLSQELRQNRGDFLEERRGIIALSLAAIGCMGLIVLYQTGVIKHLPEPELPGLDADKVDASEEAYSYFETPDAAIGLGSYAVTLGLAAMGWKGTRKKNAVGSARARRKNHGRRVASCQINLRSIRETSRCLSLVFDRGDSNLR
jgi:hypothetical protein